MKGNSHTVACGPDPGGNNIATFTYKTLEQADVTIRHVSLAAHQEMALLPSTIDEACMVILHRSEADRFELHGLTGMLWSGRRNPGSVNVIERQEAVTLKAFHRLDALILGIPHLSVPHMAPEAQDDGGEGHAKAHDAEDAVGHRLGLAFLAALASAVDPHPPSAVHLARALCYHFAFKHAWVQEKFASAEQGRLAPWQARTAATLLDRGDLQVREVAAACRLSSGAFSRRFRATFSRSPNDWKAGRRIDAVKKLLIDTGASLADAALQAGFSNQASMSRSFRRLVGASPSAWRASQGEGQAWLHFAQESQSCDSSGEDSGAASS